MPTAGRGGLGLRRGSARGKTGPPASAYGDRVDSHPRRSSANRPDAGIRITRVTPARSTRQLGLRPCFTAGRRSRASHAASPEPSSTVGNWNLRPARAPIGRTSGAAAIRCGLARSAAAVNRRRRSPTAAAVAGHRDSDAPEPDLFLEDVDDHSRRRGQRKAHPPPSDFPRDVRWIAAAPLVWPNHLARRLQIGEQPQSGNASGHSYLSAIAGSILVARRAGISAATAATSVRSLATSAKASGSLAFTPNSRLASNRVKP